MDFKILKLSLHLLLAINFISCSPSVNTKGEYLIGTSLDSISSLSDTNNLETLSLYDKTTKRIHKFDLDSMELKNSFEVLNPNDDHYIIANNEDSYTIDLSESQISIYNQYNERVTNPFRFNGKPLSAAYNKTNGHLVVYDDLSSVGLLKLSPFGQVINSWVGGPIISGDNSLLAGDISNTGKLILSLSNNSLAIIDIEQSLVQKSWAFSLQTTSYQDIKWLSNVDANKIIFQSDTHLVLYDYETQSVVSSLETNNLSLSLYSKANNPHVLFQKANGNYILAYTDGLNIRTREIPQINDTHMFLQSTLDLDSDQWSAVKYKPDFYANIKGVTYINSTVYERRADTFRFSDMLSVSSTVLPDKAQLKQAHEFIFALHPSELGYVEKIDLISNKKSSLKLFNIKYLK